MAITDKPRMVALAVSEGLRRTRRRFRTGMTSLVSFSGFVPERLLIAPQDLHTADPTLAQEFYRGQYCFAGVTVETGGKSPFNVVTLERGWLRQLHNFGWIRHLAVSNEVLSSNHARAIVYDWIKLHGRGNGDVAWEIEIVSNRLIAWLSHSIVIVSGADHEFYRQFMRAIGYHVRYLKKHAASASSGMPVMVARAALAYASVCLAGQKSYLKFARHQLDQELAGQIFPDGGHVSRNPDTIVELLALLLPLRQCCTSVGVAPSQELISAIERLLPAMRFFRMGNGSLARFNHARASEFDLITTLLGYDEARGEPLFDASQSGYQRMVVGNSTLLMDVGNPPSGELSATAHAGCLSFEFSCGQDCLVVNCGTPLIRAEDAEPVWRSTAAHSTAVLNDTSSCKFDISGPVARYLGGQIFSGNLNTRSSREDMKSASTVTASHEGYVRDFGITHHRSVTLDEGGGRLCGKDRFSDQKGANIKHATRDSVALRFHLHPDVRVARTDQQNVVMLETRDGSQWRFACHDGDAGAEKSVFFAAPSGMRKTMQIVIYVSATKSPEINWMFRKIS